MNLIPRLKFSWSIGFSMQAYISLNLLFISLLAEVYLYITPWVPHLLLILEDNCPIHYCIYWITYLQPSTLIHNPYQQMLQITPVFPFSILSSLDMYAIAFFCNQLNCGQSYFCKLHDSWRFLKSLGITRDSKIFLDKAIYVHISKHF